MEFDKIEAAIDELYLLHKKAEERGGRQEVQHQQRLDALRSEYRLLQKERRQQWQLQQEMNALNTHIQGVYSMITKVGIGLLVAIVLGIIIIGFSWHHVNTQVEKKQKILDEINFFYNDLSFVNKKNGTYVRIVPRTVTTNFHDDNDKYYDGEYAKLYVK